MKCPVDNETLVMADRSGIEIDYCPKCRGVWLDRGELDKIIERAAPTPAVVPPPLAAPQTPPAYGQPQQGYARSPGRDHDDDDRYKRKRREGFLGELFDF